MQHFQMIYSPSIIRYIHVLSVFVSSLHEWIPHPGGHTSYLLSVGVDVSVKRRLLYGHGAKKWLTVPTDTSILTDSRIFTVSKFNCALERAREPK
jgi:hypothetical protein